MQIKKITLFTKQLEAQKDFYHNTLGFKIKSESTDHFSIQVGYSELTFKASHNEFKYHYCFLIPSNQLDAATQWLQSKTDLIIDQNGTIQHRFESWNANSIYYYDPDGNIAELIVRHDLKNESSSNFDYSQFLSFNEIGTPTTDVNGTNQLLLEKTNSPFWKGDLERFGTNGTQEGLFLLVNYDIKKTWYPTTVPIQPAPYQATIEVDGIEHFVDYSNGTLKV